MRAKTLIGGLFGAVALGLAAFVAFTGDGRAYLGQGQPHPLYRIAAVDRGLIQAEVHATGTLRPLVAVPVVSQTAGELREVLVAENAAVKAGQVLMQIDPLKQLATVQSQQGTEASITRWVSYDKTIPDPEKLERFRKMLEVRAIETELAERANAKRQERLKKQLEVKPQ